MKSVSEITILARVLMNESDFLALPEYVIAAEEALGVVDGYLGTSAWERTDAPFSAVICYQYASVEAAETGLVALTGIPLLVEQQHADYRPADVLRLVTASRHGARPHETELTHFLSMSTRVADPGCGEKLSAEVAGIFEQLRLLPGYLGSLHGANDSLPEEIAGIAVWESEAAYRKSIPPTARDYEVRLYRRIA